MSRIDPPSYPPPPPPGYAPPPPPPRRPRPSGVSRGLVFVLVIICFYFAFRTFFGGFGRPASTPRPVTPRGDLAADEESTIKLFQEASDCVVYITNAALQRGFRGLSLQEIPQGTGSGFIWDNAGHIVTNFHVVAAASQDPNRNKLKVTLSNHTTWNAQIIGVEPDKDLAVLQIAADPSMLPPIPVGESNNLLVGQKVFAIGNPFGLDQTLTTGIVSALGRSMPAITGRTIEDLIQTDAAINPGNSGGPLMDSAGRLIGVNTAIISPSGTSAGIGFAVPVDTVNQVVPQLIQHGRVIRPQLGVYLAREEVLRRMDEPGVMIGNVQADSGAEQAGLRGMQQGEDGLILGDIILKIDDVEVNSRDDILDTLEQRKIGDTVKVMYKRGEEIQEVDVTLQ